MTNLRNWIPLAVAAVAIISVFVLSSWDFKNTYAAWNDNGYDNCDTIPKKKKRSVTWTMSLMSLTPLTSKWIWKKCRKN